MLAFYYDHIHLFSASVICLFSLYLFINRHVHHSVIHLFWFSVTVAIWQLDLYGLIRAQSVSDIYEWRRIPRVATMLLAPMMLQFVYSLVNRSLKEKWFISSFSIGVCFALYRFVFYHHESYTQRLFFWTPNITPLLIAYFIFTYGLFFLALALLFKKYLGSQDIIFKKQVLYTFVALFSFVFFNLDILPVVFNGERIQFIGSLAVIFFFVLTSYAITRHDLFDIKLVITGTSARLIQSILEKLVKVFDRETLFKTLAEELNTTLDVLEEDIVIAVKNQSQASTHFYSLQSKKEQILTPSLLTKMNQLRGVVNEKGVFYFPLFSSTQLEGYFVLGHNQPITQIERPLTLVQNQVIPLLDRIEPYEKIKAEYQTTLKQLDDVKWQLARSEKIATLARTAELCHHEVRTPISVMQLCLENLDDDSEKEALISYKKDVQAQLDRLSYIVNTSLAISSKKDKHKELLDIQTVIEQSIDLLPISGFSLKTKFKATSQMKGVAGDLISVFTNLIANAKRAMPDGGVLTIVTEDNGKTIQITVSDTGHGISKENLEKIWEPYFTTDITNGYGLGLSLVHQIIQDHNGKITVESETGKGTTFKLGFPSYGEISTETK